VNKSELVSRMTERLGDRTAALAAVNGVLEEIESSVARGERVSLLGFGTFDRRERAPRTARNPRTGAPVEVAAASIPVFRPGAAFRSRLDASPVAVAAAPAAPAAVRAEVAPSGKKAGKKDKSKSEKRAAKADAAPAKSGKGKKPGKKGR
jgi:DNA-binding protein HU-beta